MRAELRTISLLRAVALAASAALPSTAAAEKLVLLGGGQRHPAALGRFVDWAGGDRARLLVVAWASPEPDEAYDSLRRELLLYRPAEVRAAPSAPLQPAARAELLAALRRATGVFLSGGDQRRIIDVLRDLPLRDALVERYREGVVFAGSSAGTAVMSPVAITGRGDFTVLDGSRVEVASGLGLLPGVILDQHFIRRQRQNRLFGLVLDRPWLLGVGVDEGTALAVRDGRHAEVVGSAAVMVVEVRERRDLLLHVLEPGDTFDLKTRRRGDTGAGG